MAQAKASISKEKNQKEFNALEKMVRKLKDDKQALYNEIKDLEAQVAQAKADKEEAVGWADNYRGMLDKVV